jgi:hypothetical protein
VTTPTSRAMPFATLFAMPFATLFATLFTMLFASRHVSMPRDPNHVYIAGSSPYLLVFPP